MIAALVAGAAALSCTSIDGAERVWSRPGLRIVLVGEVHGTQEAPAVAASLVCAARRQGKPAALALEAAPAGSQPAIDRYLASEGTDADRAALLSAPMWADPVARGSVAVFDAVEAARTMGAPVVLFDPVRARSGGTDGPREQAMANALAQAAARGPVVALTGIGHADRSAFAATQPPTPSAIRRLPKESVLSLAPMVSGGQSWGCRAQDCGPQELPVRRPPSPRAVVLDGALRAGFDGGYSPGGLFSVAPPARRDG